MCEIDASWMIDLKFAIAKACDFCETTNKLFNKLKGDGQFYNIFSHVMTIYVHSVWVEDVINIHVFTLHQHCTMGIYSEKYNHNK